MGAVWYRFRAEARIRWRAWLGLVLLTGIAAGGVMALAAGARRTDSAYARYLDAQNAADVIVVSEQNDEDPTALFDMDQVAALPQVTDSAPAGYGFVAIGAGVISLTPLDDRFGVDINRLDLVEGRLPDPDRPEEIALSLTAAELDAVQVGDTVDQVEPAIVAGGVPEDLSEVPPGEQALIRQVTNLDPVNQLRVVGLVTAPGAFPPQTRSPCCAFHFQAFGEVGVPGEALAVTIDEGEEDAFRDELEQLANDLPLDILDVGAQGEDVEESIHVQTIGLWLLAGLATVVWLLVGGQLLTRLVFIEAADGPSLEAAGMSRRQRALLSVIRAAALGVLAAIAGMATAVLLSPLFPTGLAQTAEPDPGLSVDVAMLAAGAVLTVVAFVALSAIPAWVAARSGWQAAALPNRPSRLVTIVHRLGAPLPTLAGTRMALSRGQGRDAVPVISSLGTISLGIAVLVAALTFGASLNHLLDTPRLYGLGWDAQITAYGEPVADLLAPIAREHPDVRGTAAGATNLSARIEDEQVGVLGLDAIDGDLRPPALEGRLPAAADEVALGSRTFDDLGLDIGDTVDLEAIHGAAVPMTVVGTTVIPDTSEAARLGQGALTTVAGWAAVSGLPSFDAAAQDLFVDLAPGADPEAVAEDLAAVACDQEDIPPQDCVLYPIVFPPPSDVVNFGRAENFPLAVGAVLAALAAGTLVHVVVTGVRRRRRDLALLKTLGFTSRQLGLTVATQATTSVVIGLVVGVPVGLAAGRWLWTTRTEQLGVVLDTVAPLAAVALVILGGLVLANLVGLLPALSAGRTRAAEVLRSE